MFSGIVSDHWSEATFHAVFETVEGVIRKLQVYLEGEVSLEGIDSFIWDSDGEIVAELHKDEDGAYHPCWAWRDRSDDVIATIFDDHMGRRLMFMNSDDLEDVSQEMEWFDDDIDDDIDEDEDPTMVAVLITDSDDLFMIGSGTPEALARDISFRLTRKTDVPIGGVWRLSDGQQLMKVQMVCNAWVIKWDNLSSGDSLILKYEDCIG
jgi:hypothetical protein